LPVEFWEEQATEAFVEVQMPAMPRVGEYTILQGTNEVTYQVVRAGYYVHSATSNKAWIVVQEVNE
jgi:hypothetical protein